MNSNNNTVTYAEELQFWTRVGRELAAIKTRAQLRAENTTQEQIRDMISQLLSDKSEITIDNISRDDDLIENDEDFYDEPEWKHPNDPDQ